MPSGASPGPGGQFKASRRIRAEKALIKRPDASRPFSAPPHHLLPPSNPLAAPLGEVLTLGYQALVNRAGQQGDAVPADLIAEVLTGDADLGGSGGSQNIAIQVVPFLNGARVSRASSGHRSLAGTPVLLRLGQKVKCRRLKILGSKVGNGFTLGLCTTSAKD
jgi:hypothetical protein